MTSSSPNSASRLLFYDRLDCFFPFSNSLEIGDIFPKHRPGNIVTFDIPHISKRKPFLTGYFSLLLNSSICFEISFCFLLYSVMYVVRCKKRDALPQPRAEIRQFRTLQQCHSAGSLHLSSSEIRRTLEQNLSLNRNF